MQSDIQTKHVLQIKLVAKIGLTSVGILESDLGINSGCEFEDGRYMTRIENMFNPHGGILPPR